MLFACNGLQAGSYTLLVADLAQSLRLSPGPLSVALAALSAGAMAGVLVFGRLADHWSRRSVLVLGCAGAGVFYVGLGQVGSFPLLVVVMAIGGALVSGFDLSPTTLGGDYEREHDTPSMNPFFAAQDVGGAIGAGLCGVALALGVTYTVVYAGLGTVLILVGLAALGLPLPAAQSTTRHADSAEPAATADGRVAIESSQSQGKRGVVAAVAFISLISLIDAAMEGFSSLYLREDLGAGPALAGAVIAASLLVSGAGRLGGQALLQRTGERQVMVTAACATSLAIAMLVATPLPLVAGIGLLLLRLGQGPIAPIGYSLAARSTPHRAGHTVSLGWLSLYAAFLIGPLIVGAIAELTGLRLALGTFIAAALTLAILATTFARPVLTRRSSK